MKKDLEYDLFVERMGSFGMDLEVMFGDQDEPQPPNRSLTHYGVKGMKWGVRRYQNKDGTLTTAGRKRRSGKSSGIRKKLRPKTRAIEKKTELSKSTNARRLYRNRHLLSDAELRDRVNRINMEQQLGRLAANERSVGSRAASKVISSAGNAVMNTVIQEGINYGKKETSKYIKKRRG